MKLYLDDKRNAPKEWIRVMSADSMIKFLERDQDNQITNISLDHDLGDENKKGTGYDVLLWIEKEVFCSGYSPPNILIHTSNPSAREKMEAALKSINKMKRGGNK